MREDDVQILFGIGVWPVASISEQPSTRLARWSIWETRKGKEAPTRHFVGWSINDSEGRVSSQIVAFDPETRRGETKSGRVYELVGLSGHDRDGDYVFSVWLKLNQRTVWREITREVVSGEKE